MNAAIHYEPDRLPAGLLALVVHIVFFGLLIFGFSWSRQVASPPAMSVELWQSLPDMAVTLPPPAPRIEEPVQPPPPPPPAEVVVKPEIVIPDKTIKPKVEVKPVVAPPEKKKVEMKPVPEKVVERKSVESDPIERAAAQQAEQAARERAEQAAARAGVVDEYAAKINAKIRGNIVWWEQVVPGRAEFFVTLLPGGPVLKAELKKSSGNEAYDKAVERAILKSTPLPVPPDVSLFSRFREMSMGFNPADPTK